MSRSEMINTRSDDIKAYVDLTRADAGDVKGVPIQVVLPSSDETVVSIDPQSVDIRVELSGEESAYEAFFWNIDQSFDFIRTAGDTGYYYYCRQQLGGAKVWYGICQCGEQDGILYRI